ncbi:MAG: hypothetical protein O3A01_01865, partial [bacterium]|nr:hypothetical protein [bacterium]
PIDANLDYESLEQVTNSTKPVATSGRDVANAFEGLENKDDIQGSLKSGYIEFNITKDGNSKTRYLSFTPLRGVHVAKKPPTGQVALEAQRSFEIMNTLGFRK